MTSDLEIGFDRPKSDPLPGTVKLYQRHLFICTGRDDWPSHIDQAGGFAQTLAELLAARAAGISLKVKLTACDDPSIGPGYDLLLFPDMIRYQNAREADLPALVEDHFINDRITPRIRHEPLAGWHVFVCVHGRRDARCGVCGPPVAEALVAAVAARGLSHHVTLHRTSHVGGHALAANVLIYPGGEWYGYVTPEDAPRIVDEHILSGRLVMGLWRGRMGLPPMEHMTLVEAWRGR